MKYEEIEKGQKVSKEVKIYQDDVDEFICITGDKNPVHIGEGAIVHGMLVASYISTMIGMHLPGAGAIMVRQNISFLSPVYVNDELTVEAQVMDKMPKFNQIKLGINIYNQHGVMVLSSTSLVKCQ